MLHVLRSTAIVTVLACLLGACAADPPAPRVGADSARSAPGEPAPLVVRTMADYLPLVQSSDYRPSALALALQSRPASAAPQSFGVVKAPLTVQQGEIVIMEGDASTVATLAPDTYGVVMTAGAQNPPKIAAQFLDVYPDEFDAICVFTTFPDAGSQDSVAWHLSVRQTIDGIGAQKVDSGPLWGSANGGQLHSFINMQYIGKYGGNLGYPTHWIHGVAAHEFAHRWLVHVKYVDASGTLSTSLLGRQQSHWANGVQAFGSVMDGNQWKSLGGGKFKLQAKDQGFSPLDMYLMGFGPAEEVEDFFLIAALQYKGKLVDPAVSLPNGATVSGIREDIAMSQILAAHGARAPGWEEAQKDFRVAIVLLTRPGEKAQQVAQLTERLEEFRVAFEQRIPELTQGRVHVCTQVSGPCDSAGVALAGLEVSEHDGNGNGQLEPGETAAIWLSVKATGVGPAVGVQAELGEPSLPDLSIITPYVLVGDIGEGEVLEAPNPLFVKIPPFIDCGAEAVFPLKLETEGRFFYDEVRLSIGAEVYMTDDLESPEGWSLNPYGTDDVEAGGWEIDKPQGVDAFYLGLDLITQPSQDHTGSGGNALVTGFQAGQVGDHDVDDGTTTALSPVYPLGSNVRDPLLTWYSWHFAWDFNTPEGAVPVDDDPLITEITLDEGASWVVVDVDVSNEQQWRRKQVRLRDFGEPSASVQVRFTVSDLGTPTLTEAAIDDLSIWDESLVCRPDLVPPPPVEPQDPVEPQEDPEPTVGEEDPVQPEDSNDGCSAAPRPRRPGGLWLLAGLLLGLSGVSGVSRVSRVSRRSRRAA